MDEVAVLFGEARRLARLLWPTDQVEADSCAGLAVAEMAVQQPQELWPKMWRTYVRRRIVDSQRAAWGRDGTRPILEPLVQGYDEEVSSHDWISRTPDCADEAASRVDAERLLATMSPREAELVVALTDGFRLHHVAARWGRTESRACQIRKQLRERLAA